MARAVDEMRQELAAIRQQTSQKDQQIASLQQELSALRVAHEEMVSRVAPERVARMEQEIQALQEQRANVELPARPRRRPRSQ
jgi:hypothetical protein